MQQLNIRHSLQPNHIKKHMKRTFRKHFSQILRLRYGDVKMLSINMDANSILFALPRITSNLRPKEYFNFENFGSVNDAPPPDRRLSNATYMEKPEEICDYCSLGCEPRQCLAFCPRKKSIPGISIEKLMFMYNLSEMDDESDDEDDDENEHDGNDGNDDTWPTIDLIAEAVHFRETLKEMEEVIITSEDRIREKQYLDVSRLFESFDSEDTEWTFESLLEPCIVFYRTPRFFGAIDSDEEPEINATIIFPREMNEMVRNRFKGCDFFNLQCYEKTQLWNTSVLRLVRQNRFQVFEADKFVWNERHQRYRVSMQIDVFEPTSIEVRLSLDEEWVFIVFEIIIIKSNGSYSRCKLCCKSYFIPEDVDVSQMAYAISKDHVITVTFPKKSRKIELCGLVLHYKM